MAKFKYNPEIKLALEAKLDAKHLPDGDTSLHFTYGKPGDDVSGGIYFKKDEIIPKMLILFFEPHPMDDFITVGEIPEKYNLKLEEDGTNDCT